MALPTTYLKTSISTFKSIYISLGTTYFDLHPSLHNNALIPLGLRERLFTEFATPAPFDHLHALPLSNRVQQSESALTPFELTVLSLEKCAQALQHLTRWAGTLMEDDGSREFEILSQAQSLLQRAAEQLSGIWAAVEAHLRLEAVLAGMGATLRNVERNERLMQAEMAWLVRSGEWAVTHG